MNELISKTERYSIRRTDTGYETWYASISQVAHFATLEEAQAHIAELEKTHAEAVDLQNKIDSGAVSFLDALDTITE